MCRPRAPFTAIFLALVIAGLCRAVATGVAQPASRALPEGVRHPADQPVRCTQGGARTLAVLGPDSVGQERRRLRHVPPSGVRVRREPRRLHRRQRPGPWQPAAIRCPQYHSIRQAEQPDNPERRVQRHRCVGPLRSRHGADVLGPPGSEPGGSGPRAHRVVRRDAWRRLQRGRGARRGDGQAGRHRRVSNALQPRFRRRSASDRGESWERRWPHSRGR